MRSRQALTARLVLVASLIPALPARAAEPASGSAEGPLAANTESARAHFKTGVKLYQDQNYAGALAEFEAAYAQKPGPGSLQNIALCQKALFRYGEAAGSLERLLGEHGAELSEAERSAAERAKAELEGLVGVVRVEVTPPNADVTLDGRPWPPAERKATVRLNVGEHLFAASAPGYGRVTRSLTVASGQGELSVSLALQPTSGFLDVSSPDPQAAIAIDGKPVAYGRFTGPVTPGEPHLVQIYKEGAPPFETRVTAPLGQTVIVSSGGAPGLATPSGAAGSASPPSAAGAKPPLGWYAMGSVSWLGTGTPPFRFDLSEASSRAFGLGIRAGRRFRPAVAVEGLVEYSSLKVEDACDRRRGELAVPPIACDSPQAAELDVSYSVRSFRFGPTLELMTTGPRWRALGGLGLGLVWHQLECTGCIADREQKSSGTDAYFLMELGVGANTRHVLMALALKAIIDGTANMIPSRDLGSKDTPNRETAYERSGRALPYVGLELRLGFSEWAP